VSMVRLGVAALAIGAAAAWAAEPPEPLESRAGQFGNDVLYYIVIDRFQDGDPRNNVPEWAFAPKPDDTAEERRIKEENRAILPLMYDGSGRCLGLYQGGDLQGVIDKLDYLADLGVTKIILSPICDNVNGFVYSPAPYYARLGPEDRAPAPPQSHFMTSFHGYWTRDWFTLEEHFRDPDDEGKDPYRIFKTLLAEAGKRGIGVMLDVTLNHSSLNASPNAATASVRADGTPMDADGQPAHWLALFPDDASIFKFGKLLRPYRTDAEVPELVKRPWQSWFHRPGFDIDFTNPTPRELYDGRLPGGMPDLRQETWPMRHYLLDSVAFWAGLRQEPDGPTLAGYRVDAIKHVPPDFWLDMEYDYGRQAPDGILLGEYFDGGYGDAMSVDFLDKTRRFTIYDFELSLAMGRFFARDRGWAGRAPYIRRLVLGGNGEGALPEVLRRALNPAGLFHIPEHAQEVITPEVARDLVVFLENHDFPRLRTQYPAMSDAAYQSAIRFLFTVRGVPVLVYGTETGLGLPWDPRHAGLFGIGGDPFNRPKMVFPGAEGWNEQIYQTVRAMARLRKSLPVLRAGASRFIDPEGSDYSNDLFMVREDEKHPHENPAVLFAYATKGGDFAVRARDVSEAGALRDWETGEVLPMAEGVARVRLKPEESKVFVIEHGPAAVTSRP